MNWNDTLRQLAIGLPEDIARLKAAGYCQEAIAQVDALLAEDWEASARGAGVLGQNPMPRTPQKLREGLLAQREILRRLPAEYPFTLPAALEKLRAKLPGFTMEQLQALVRENRIDWRFIDGEKHCAARFYETLVDADAAFAAQLALPADNSRRLYRQAVARRMQEQGQVQARIRIRAALRPTDAAFAAAMALQTAAGRSAVRARVWLPLPAACPSQSGITLLGFSAPPTSIAPDTAPQRTAYWETELTENTTFTAEYSYLSTAVYQDPLAPGRGAAPAADLPAPESCLGEQLPHIAFTPYLRALTAQLTQDVADPAQKAKRIYDYITCNVRYRYMPAYFVLDSIADNCARSRRGDCGVQALTFIAMCRLAGIPALWQSGLMVMPQETGSHDWAMFWLPDHGWLYADCSFGGGAAENGDALLQRHYFGNLDPGRMAANHAFQARLTPPKESWRADPYDNQSGEAELEGVGLMGSEQDTKAEVLQYEDCE